MAPPGALVHPTVIQIFLICIIFLCFMEIAEWSGNWKAQKRIKFTFLLLELINAVFDGTCLWAKSLKVSLLVFFFCSFSVCQNFEFRSKKIEHIYAWSASWKQINKIILYLGASCLYYFACLKCGVSQVFEIRGWEILVSQSMLAIFTFLWLGIIAPWR